MMDSSSNINQALGGVQVPQWIEHSKSPDTLPLKIEREEDKEGLAQDDGVFLSNKIVREKKQPDTGKARRGEVITQEKPQDTTVKESRLRSGITLSEDVNSNTVSITMNEQGAPTSIAFNDTTLQLPEREGSLPGPRSLASLITGKDEPVNTIVIENKNLRQEISPDGTIVLVDKTHGDFTMAELLYSMGSWHRDTYVITPDGRVSGSQYYRENMASPETRLITREVPGKEESDGSILVSRADGSKLTGAERDLEYVVLKPFITRFEVLTGEKQNPPREREFYMLLDESASMEGKNLDRAKKALERAGREITRSNDGLAIIGYSGKPVVHKSLDQDFDPVKRDAIFKEIDRSPHESTDDLNAVQAALNMLKKEGSPGARKIIFHITDGMSSNNQAEMKNIIRKAEEDGIKFIAVGIGPDSNAEMNKVYDNGVYVDDVSRLPALLSNLVRAEIKSGKPDESLELRQEDLIDPGVLGRLNTMLDEVGSFDAGKFPYYMNPDPYAGRQKLSEAMKNRFMSIELPDLHITPHMKTVLGEIRDAERSGESPILLGPAASGKLTILKDLGSPEGKLFYLAETITDLDLLGQYVSKGHAKFEYKDGFLTDAMKPAALRDTEILSRPGRGEAKGRISTGAKVEYLQSRDVNGEKWSQVAYKGADGWVKGWVPDKNLKADTAIFADMDLASKEVLDIIAESINEGQVQLPRETALSEKEGAPGILKAHPSFKLFGTATPSPYTGREVLPRDLTASDRVRLIDMDKLNPH